ncbi:MAG TPA: HAMP domain-containing sensor histidine kinase [Candidatus Sulfotelmatobacter sp.]|jgi:signal transduction histidine kinase|nr:HAMP domain-containing sensor histidine kinase [Candidatus Sulfotelmatobacter sp.]
MKNWISKNFLISRSQDKDKARRELILQILLLGSILLSFIASLVSWSVTLSQKKLIRFESIEITGIFLLFITAYLWSRRRNGEIVAYFFIGFYLLITIYSSYVWGAEIPNGLLSYALIIVMTGILINSRVAFLVTLFISCIIIFLVYGQTHNILSVITNWRTQPETVANAIGYSVTLSIIAIVSWLFNRETEQALLRARLSETALKRQKNSLEVLVEARTQQLKQAQLEKITELYRFAEFGRIASGLFHDLTNPLTLVSLNLHELSKNKLLIKTELSDIERNIQRAIMGTKTLENFINAARKQIQNQEIKRKFLLASEITQVIQIMDSKTKENKVILESTLDNTLLLTGNPIKFSQLIFNLLANAIESYDASRRKKRVVGITLARQNNEVMLTIQDWGRGIEKKYLATIFEPLFTTKTPEKGTGIGLSLSKEIIEKGFGGKITVTSNKKQGTLFTVSFPLGNAHGQSV